MRLCAAITPVLVAACLAGGVQAADPALDAQIDAAIEQGLAWTWTLLQPNGMFGWQDPRKNPGDYFYYGDWEVTCMTSLAYGGVRPEDPRIKTALKTLIELDLDRTYTIGFRMIALAEFYRNAEDNTKPGLRAALKSDVDRLLAFHHDDGSWHYYGRNAAQWDFSNTQIAVLALSEAVACGVEVNQAVFQKVLKLYLDKQQADGGWNYGNPMKPAGTGPSYASMTAAGTANTFLLRYLLNPGQGCPCRGGRSGGRRDLRLDKAIDRGIQWLAGNLADKNWALDAEGDVNPYLLYACERVGIYTGLKYLGPHDWYAEGARQLLAKLKFKPGGRGTRGDAMFALLFLIKGRGPILMNKLRYDGPWDLHPRDAANLADYVGRIKEQRINWQVIPLDIPVEEMHDSPILYISAEERIGFTDQEKKKLREFTDTGGTILLEASCSNRTAGAWWNTLCREVWPEWELEPVDKDHPVWSADLAMSKRVPGLQGIDDGLRTFLFYSPNDVSCKWHTMSVARDEVLFQLGNNLYAYATDRGRLRSRLAARDLGVGARYAEAKPAFEPKGRTLAVARLAHGGRWHVNRRYRPWQMLADDLKAKFAIGLTEVEPLAAGQDIPPEVDLVYLAGRDRLELSDEAVASLKKYLAGGGLLFAEATLGDEAFDASFRQAMKAAGLALEPVADDGPLITGQIGPGATGYPLADVDYTFALRPVRIGRTKPLVFRIESGGRMVGLYSPYDIMFSQTGCLAFGSRGYAAGDARALALNIALLACGRPR